MTAGTPWRTFAVCVGVACVTILDLSKINVALPSIQADLSAAPADLQLLIAGFALAVGLTLVPAGRLGDLYSRRAIFLVGIGVFTLASAACGLATSTGVLITARVVQGIGTGILMPQVLGYIQQLFSGSARGRAFGAYGAGVGIAAAVGPTVGGLLIALGGEEDGWRLLFWMNVPLGIAGFVMAWRLLPPSMPKTDADRNLDLVGVLLLGLAVLGIMLPFTLGSGTLGEDPQRWLWLVAAAVAFAGFLAWERRLGRTGKDPAVPLALFRIRSYRNGLTITASYFAAAPTLFVLATFFLQQGLGFDALGTGLVTLTFALGSAVSAWAGGRLVSRVGVALVAIGFSTVILGFSLWVAAMVFVPAEFAPWLVPVTFLVSGLGAGFVIAPINTVTLADVPTARAGVAGSVLQVGQRVGTAVGVSVASALYFAALAAGDGRDFRAALVAGVAACIAFLLVGLTLALREAIRGGRG